MKLYWSKIKPFFSFFRFNAFNNIYNVWTWLKGGACHYYHTVPLDNILHKCVYIDVPASE